MGDSKDAVSQLMRVAIHSALAWGCFYLTKVCAHQQKKHQKEVKKVRKAFHKILEYEPEELVNKLETLYKKEKNHTKYIDCGKFFVKGIISCDKPISSFKHHHTKLVYQNLKKYDIVAKVKENKVLDHSR